MLGTFSGGGLGMGVVFTLQDQFSKTADTINRNMNSLSGNADLMASRVNRSMSLMTAGVKSVAVGIGILAPLLKGANVRAEFEAYETQLTTVLGSAEKAQRTLANIKKDALANPLFGTKELVEANANLIANNVETSRARGLVNNLANALAGVGKGNEELSRMGVNLQQIAATGKATGVDIKQFGYAGIPIYKLLADATGKSIEEMREMGDITLPVLENAFQKASEKGGMFYKALENAGKTSKGLKAQMEDNIVFMFEGIGRAIEPVTKKLYMFLSDVAQKLREFSNSHIGSFLIKLVAVLGIVLVVGGAFALLLGGLKLAVLKLTLTLPTATSFVTLFGRAVAIATGPVGILIGAIYVLYKSFQEFGVATDKFVKKDGLVGWFQKIGGYLTAVGEIWSSWNGKIFTISADLKTKLETLGIFDSVLAMGTWLVRIKEFLKGFVLGFYEGFKAVKRFIIEAGNAVGDILSYLGVEWDKSTSQIERWKETGKVAGYVIIGVLSAISIYLVAMAVSFVTAFAVPIAIIGGVTAVLWGIWKVAGYVWKAFKKVGDAISYAFGIVKSAWNSIFGESTVEAKIQKKVDGTVKVVGAEAKRVQESKVKPSEKAIHHEYTTKTLPMYYMNKENQKEKSTNTYIIQNIMDGEVISEKVMEKQEFKQARQ